MLTESTLKADGAMSRTIIDAGDYFVFSFERSTDPVVR